MELPLQGARKAGDVPLKLVACELEMDALRV